MDTCIYIYIYVYMTCKLLYETLKPTDPAINGMPMAGDRRRRRGAGEQQPEGAGG